MMDEVDLTKMLAQDMTDAQKRERMRQLRKAAGDTDQSLVTPFDGRGSAGQYRDGPGVNWQTGDLMLRIK